MKTSLKAGFAQIFSCCPKNLSCPKFGGAAAPLAPPARTPMNISPGAYVWNFTVYYTKINGVMSFLSKTIIGTVLV